MAALSRVRIKLPAVVSAFDVRAVELAEGKRKRAVRTDVAQSKRLPCRVSSQHQWNFEQHRANEFSATHFAAARGRIPESPQKISAGVRARCSRIGHGVRPSYYSRNGAANADGVAPQGRKAAARLATESKLPDTIALLVSFARTRLRMTLHRNRALENS